MMKHQLGATLLLTGMLCVGATPAMATEGCVTHGEFDNMERLLSVQQVAGRFDTNGWYIGSGEDRWRRGYQACWTDERKVVVWYSLNTGLSDDWAMRDY